MLHVLSTLTWTKVCVHYITLVSTWLNSGRSGTWLVDGRSGCDSTSTKKVIYRQMLSYFYYFMNITYNLTVNVHISSLGSRRQYPSLRLHAFNGSVCYLYDSSKCSVTRSWIWAFDVTTIILSLTKPSRDVYVN